MVKLPKRYCMIRVALVGSSSTGKTTVFELLQNKLGSEFTFINESTRTVASYGFPINEDGNDMTQLAISSFHLQALTVPHDLILDRCYLDLTVYSSLIKGISEETLRFITDTWEQVSKRYTHYIYFPIEFKSVDDGVRSVNEVWRKRVDREFRFKLDSLGIEYLTVSGSPKERVKQIIDYIDDDK